MKREQGGWTNLISTRRAIEDQGDDELAFDLAITGYEVTLEARREEEWVRADTSCVGGVGVDRVDKLTD